MTNKKSHSISSASRRSVLGGLAATAGVLAAPQIMAPAVMAQARGLKVGVLLPRSGLFAQAGQSCQRGVTIAPAVLAQMGVNAEIVSVDTESSVDIARTQAEKLANEGVNLFVGAFESQQTLAIAQVAEQRGIPLMINIAAAPPITEQGFKFTFRNFPKSGTLVANGLSLMKDLFAATGKTPKNAVFLHANDTFGQANRGAMDALFPRADMPFQLLESIAYDPKAQDLSVEVAKVRGSRAELVIVTTRAGDAIKLIREMVKQRYEPMAIVSPGSPGMYDDEFYQALGKFADFSISNVPWVNPNSDLTKQMAQEFAKQLPGVKFENNAFNAGFTLEALVIGADAFKRAGSGDPKALADAIRQTKLEQHVMVGPAITFDEKGQNNNISSACVQNFDNTPTVTLPAAAATRAPVFPAPGWQQRG